MEILRSLFVLFFFCSLFFFITCIFRLAYSSGRRLAILQAFLIIGGLTWLITELLSIFRAITFAGLAGLWGIVYLVVLAILMRVSNGKFRDFILNELHDLRRHIISIPRGLLVVLIFMAAMILVLGLTAFIAAPNNWDSMTYHLSRVMHWIQDRSLAFYPTMNDRQLYLGPMAEMFILNFQILAGNDQLANLVQFFAMVGCVVGVSLIAQLLGGNIYAQVFSTFAMVTLPMGILQSTTTQNDHVSALWLVCFVVLVLVILQLEELTWYIFLLIGMSLGLAFLTKPTVLLFGVPFGLWMVYALISRFGVKVWTYFLLLTCAILLIVIPHVFRTYQLYTSPLGPVAELDEQFIKVTNNSYGPSVLGSNLLRNIGIHLGTPSEDINSLSENIIIALHTFMRANINDPATTWPGTKFAIIYFLNEDVSGNPIHFMLIGVSIILLVFQRKKQEIVYAVCLAAGFILFSWLLKWQPWHSRLHLPWFVLTMPFIGVILSRSLKQWMLYSLIVILGYLSYIYMFHNPRRPFIGVSNIFTTDRLRQYFKIRPDKIQPYDRQMKAINELQCNNVGLIAGGDDGEYLIWVMARSNGVDIHLEHVLVNNPSGALETDFAPCAILATYPIQGETITYQNRSYTKFREEDSLTLYVPTP